MSIHPDLVSVRDRSGHHARSNPRSIVASFLFLVTLFLLSVGSSQAASTAGAGSGIVDEVTRHLKAGEYDRTIEILRRAMGEADIEPEIHGEMYLLLIKTYVLLSNSHRSRGDAAKATYYLEKARGSARECLRSWELRGVRAEPAVQYPPEMVELFQEVRADALGSFRVIALEPADATVTLDGHLLPASPGELPGAIDIPVGVYEVEVRASGHKTLREEVTISAGTMLERGFRLKKGWAGTFIPIGIAIFGAGVLVGTLIG